MLMPGKHLHAWFILTRIVQSDTLASGRVDTCVVCFGYILSSDVARAIDTLNITTVHSSWAVGVIIVQMQLLACSGHIKVVVLLGTANNLQNTSAIMHMHNHAIVNHDYTYNKKLYNHAFRLLYFCYRYTANVYSH